jgi:Zinc knuckle
MDIDQARGKGSPAITCFRCCKTGHYATECPQAFDIHLMTTAEKLELLPEFLAVVDVVGDPPRKIHPKVQNMEKRKQKKWRIL